MVKNRIDFVNEIDLSEILMNCNDINISKLYMIYLLKCNSTYNKYNITIDFINNLYGCYIDSDLMNINDFVNKFDDYFFIISYDFNDFSDFDFNEFNDFLGGADYE